MIVGYRRTKNRKEAMQDRRALRRYIRAERARKSLKHLQRCAISDAGYYKIQGLIQRGIDAAKGRKVKNLYTGVGA